MLIGKRWCQNCTHADWQVISDRISKRFAPQMATTGEKKLQELKYSTIMACSSDSTKGWVKMFFVISVQQILFTVNLSTCDSLFSFPQPKNHVPLPTKTQSNMRFFFFFFFLSTLTHANQEMGSTNYLSSGLSALSLMRGCGSGCSPSTSARLMFQHGVYPCTFCADKQEQITGQECISRVIGLCAGKI